jgi:hypothetical protein
MKYRTILVLLALSTLAACEMPGPVQAEPTPTASADHAKPAAKYHYSPFVVQVPESEMVFGTITFKDVGLQRDASDPNDPMLETIAQSVAYSLQSTPELEVQQSRVEYHEELSHPSNHRICEMNHLYVDVWNGGDKWGYSLWSGCGNDDNFAWKEVEIPTDRSALTDRVEPLADAIAQTLVDAHDRGCYTKRC